MYPCGRKDLFEVTIVIFANINICLKIMYHSELRIIVVGENYFSHV